MAACVLAKRRGRSHGNADRSERGKAAARRPAQNERPAGGKGERCRLFVRAAPHPFKLRNVKAGGGTAVRIAARRARPWRVGLAAARQSGLRRIRLGRGAPIRDETRPFGLRRVGPACGARIRTAARHRLRRVRMPQRAESGRGASIPSIPTAGRTFCGRAAYSDSTGRALCPQTAGFDARERAFFVESIGRPARGHIS